MAVDPVPSSAIGPSEGDALEIQIPQFSQAQAAAPPFWLAPSHTYVCRVCMYIGNSVEEQVPRPATLVIDVALGKLVEVRGVRTNSCWSYVVQG